MKLHKFYIIVPFYNVSAFINQCVDTILGQTYMNYEVIFADDKSTDGTSELIPTHSKITKIYNNTRLTALENIHNALLSISNKIQDDDIVIILDGDDALLTDNVLNFVNNMYNTNPNALITYGQYVTSQGHIGHCSAYNEDEYNRLRQMDWRASHLRSFKWKVYAELMRQDTILNCYRDDNGDFYKITYDIAILYPLMEIAGYNNIYFNPEPLYYYRLHPANDHALQPIEQRRVEHHIKTKPKFTTAF